MKDKKAEDYKYTYRYNDIGKRDSNTHCPDNQIRHFVVCIGCCLCGTRLSVEEGFI